MELFKSPVAISVALIILAAAIKVWFDTKKDKGGKQPAKKDGAKKPRDFGKKARDFGKTTMRLLRRKALRRSLEKGDWKYK